MEEYFNSCSYSELRKFARDNEILKTVKSKKKKDLVDCLILYYTENLGKFEDLVPKESDISLGGEVNSLYNAEPPRKSKRNQLTAKNPIDDELTPESELCSSESSSENTCTTKVENLSPNPEKPKKRGRAKKNKDSSNEDNCPKKVENLSPNPQKTKKRGRARKNKDSSESSNEDNCLTKVKNLSPNPEKIKKRGRAKKNKEPTNSNSSDRRGTFSVPNVESKVLPQITSDNISESSIEQKNMDTDHLTDSIEPVPKVGVLKNASSGLLRGPISDGDRRGTFTINPGNQNNSDQSMTRNAGLTNSEDRKRKRVDSDNLSKHEHSILPETTTERTHKKVKIVQLVSPLILNPLSCQTPSSKIKHTMKKDNKQVTPHLSKKSVVIMTPKNGISVTPKRKNLQLTPHPTKKTSLRLSQKENSVQFSAKKMPNFSKIHQKNFEKMESLHKYTERKAARHELFSPLNKTLTGLSIKREISNIELSGRKPARSLIPIKSSRSTNRLKEIKNMSALVKKIPNTTVDSLREKERSIIKGIRTNKRFMLQMQMRNLAT